MKNSFNLLAAILLGAAVLSACNKLEVTLPRGPQGEQGVQGVAGKDGPSAYDVWVNSINDKTITDWTGGTAINDFFRYLKGKDGNDGKDGKDGQDGQDGKDGKDGTDGKSALELWREYVASGVEDPKHPGRLWDKDKTSERDFYEFLTGADGLDGQNGLNGHDGKDGLDGKDGQDGHDGQNGLDGHDGKDGVDGQDGQGGLSAYELWVADVTSEEGLDNPGNGAYDVDDYPKWPKDAVSLEDFYRYLTGRDGKDGQDGTSVVPPQEVPDPIYSERVDGQKYNVAPVIALSKAEGGSVSYEYVNPFSGGAAFIVTGPGPEIIPDCEVTFTTMDGSRTYVKTSDGAGYVYLTRNELPEWYEGAPSASDDPDNLSSGVRPLSFSFGGNRVSEPSRIAATCKVPYRVGLEMVLIEGSLRARYSLVRYEVRRVVEGQTEQDAFILSSPKTYVNDHRGCGYLHSVPVSYRYYRNEGAVKRLRDIYVTSSSTVSGLPQSSASNEELMDYFTTVANLSDPEVPGYERNVGVEHFFSPSFGNGEGPSVVDVLETFAYVSKGTLMLRKYKPDYGLTVTDPARTVHVPYIAQLPGNLTNASYVWKSGHTTLTFELDWNAVDKLKVANGYSGRWKGDTYTYDYVVFSKLPYRPASAFSSFSAKGKFNGSVIDSKVGIEWRKPVVFTDIYDSFSVTVSDVSNDYVIFNGLSGSFSYDASSDDEYGNGKAFMFGQEIPKTEEKPSL